MKKIVICLSLFLLFVSVISVSFADGGMDSLLTSMEGVKTPDTSSDKFNQTAGSVIKLIQYVGSGIALIVITMYGAKYMLASPQDKADVKKQIIPIIIGCVLLFGTVNLVSLVADTTEQVLSKEAIVSIDFEENLLG